MPNAKKKKTGKLPFLCLTMIVKNESHIITEVLQSVLPFIDYYIISDTGSTDNTKQLISDFFAKHNVKGEIYDDKWEDFGANRSLVLQHARHKVQYAWMIDADDLIRPTEAIKNRDDLHKILKEGREGYQVGIIDDDSTVFYWRTQIFNLKQDWIYEGVLHEYPTVRNKPQATSPEKIGRLDIKVISRRLGARNKLDVKEKYRMDAETLLKGLEKEPLNTRYMFYLAQSYRDCEEFEKSIEWYQKRVDFGGWYEEVYYSAYMIGKMALFNTKNEVLGVQSSLRAFKIHPKRIESMHYLVLYYIHEKQFDLASLYSSKIKDVPFPKEDGLFLENELYNYIVKFYYLVLQFLTFKPLDEDVMRDIRQKKAFKFLEDYFILKKFPSLNIGELLPFPSEWIPKNPNPLKPKLEYYRVFNPSISKNDETNELWINIRCSNFDDHYGPTDKDGMIRTHNFLATLDLSRIYKMVDKSSFYDTYRKHTKARILDYEDIRLFHYNNNWCFLANNDEIDGYINSPQMVYGKLAKEPLNDTEWAIEYVKHLKFPFQQQIEKNWVPLIYENPNQMEIVYSTQPLVILSPDFVTGLCIVKHRYDWHPTIPFPAKYTLRNSTPYVPFENGWIGLTHVVYFLEECFHQRIYYNIFVYISKDFDQIKTSDFFHFDQHLIEFANGIIQDSDHSYLISFSLSDRIPKTVRFTTEEIKNKLVYTF